MCWPKVDQKQASRIHPAPPTPPGSFGLGDAGGRKENLDGLLPSSFISQYPYSFFSRPTLTSLSPTFPIKKRDGGRWVWGWLPFPEVIKSGHKSISKRSQRPPPGWTLLVVDFVFSLKGSSAPAPAATILCWAPWGEKPVPVQVCAKPSHCM